MNSEGWLWGADSLEWQNHVQVKKYGFVSEVQKIESSPLMFFSFFLTQLGAWFHVVMSLLLSCHGLSASHDIYCLPV